MGVSGSSFFWVPLAPYTMKPNMTEVGGGGLDQAAEPLQLQRAQLVPWGSLLLDQTSTGNDVFEGILLAEGMQHSLTLNQLLEQTWYRHSLRVDTLQSTATRFRCQLPMQLYQPQTPKPAPNP